MKLCQHDECAKVSETIYEKKDACYTKVKSRYDVWPSAYASGALVKCRKVGAANWGNKSKKEGVNEEILKEDIQDLKKIVKELEGASKMHAGQAKRIQSHLDSMNVKESIIEGTFGKFDTGAGFKGNGMTVYDRNQEKSGDFRDIVHIAPNGKITIYDKNVKKEPKLMQSLNKISQEFKKTFKESVNEGKLSEDYKNSEWEVYVADENGKEKIVKKAKSKRAGVILYNKLINSDNYYEVGMRVVKESVDENILKQIQQAEKIAKSMAGNMTGAVKGIEKIRRGLSHHKRVKVALKKYNESVDEGLGDKISKNLSKYNKKNKKSRDAMKKYAKVKKLKLKGRGVYQDYDGMEGIEEAYDIWMEDGSFGGTFTGLVEAEYQGRKVKLGKPMQGDAKKFKVYVKNPKGNTVKVNFGQGGDAKGGTMKIRKSNPGARKSFRARHNCDSPGPRHKARYWSCRKW